MYENINIKRVFNMNLNKFFLKKKASLGLLIQV